ncbi:hypothetical protein [Actinacidiphila guanduensis]|uniref:Uncharacterized protein n=1 Tax=Actinacidiphila guanduensis TaxID=310781 RepID=A0A1H0B1E4_9ACTN|nr:hypothetical protein [Actinacidiphila guanduensis]SDN39490.1 hypothetical protein SAMN05216259_10411 [Actinacidiphila guanduensis]
MPGIRSRLLRAFWAVDRMLGGEQPLTRTERFVAARHPVRLGVAVGACWTAFFTLLPGTQSADVVVGVAGGMFLGALSGFTARYLRARQHRLQRIRLRDGA